MVFKSPITRSGAKWTPPFIRLDGTVERISADTITDEDGKSHYQCPIKTDQTSLESDTEDLPTIPGMAVQADILTGNKTVLDYLLKPIERAQADALGER